MNEITINVVIADRAYKITINRHDEELVRKTSNDINQKIKKISDLYHYKDKQDLLAMVILETHTELNKLSLLKDRDNSELQEKVKRLTSLIDENYLDK